MNTPLGTSDKRLHQNPYGHMDPLTAKKAQPKKNFSLYHGVLSLMIFGSALGLFFATRSAIETFSWLPAVAMGFSLLASIFFAGIVRMPYHFYAVVCAVSCIAQLIFVLTLLHALWIFLAWAASLLLYRAVQNTEDSMVKIMPSQIIHAQVWLGALFLSILITAQTYGTLQGFSDTDFDRYLSGRTEHIISTPTILERSMETLEKKGVPTDNAEILEFIENIQSNTESHEGGAQEVTIRLEDLSLLADHLIKTSLQETISSNVYERSAMILIVAFVVFLIVYTSVLFLARPLGWFVQLLFWIFRKAGWTRVDRVQKTVEIIKS